MRSETVRSIIRAYDEHKARAAEGEVSLLDSHANGKPNGTESALLNKNGGDKNSGLPSEVETSE